MTCEPLTGWRHVAVTGRRTMEDFAHQMRWLADAAYVCQACPAFRVCTRAKEIGRSLAVGPHDAVLRRHRAWMSTSAAKEAYGLRKQLVEPVFGIIKEQQVARRFVLRGLANVTAECTGPCWPQPSTCALYGGYGAPAYSSIYLMARSLVLLPELRRCQLSSTRHSIASRIPSGQSGLATIFF